MPRKDTSAKHIKDAYERAIALIRRISLAEADGLDTARDSAILEKAINQCRTFLKTEKVS